jgi:hypothetical protein
MWAGCRSDEDSSSQKKKKKKEKKKKEKKKRGREEDESRPKKRKKRSSGGDSDGGGSDAEAHNKEKRVFEESDDDAELRDEGIDLETGEVVASKGKPGQKRSKKEIREMRERELTRIKDFVLKLKKAALEDRNAYKEKKMATKKMELLETLRTELARKRTQQDYLEMDILKSLKLWLDPLDHEATTFKAKVYPHPHPHPHSYPHPHLQASRLPNRVLAALSLSLSSLSLSLSLSRSLSLKHTHITGSEPGEQEATGRHTSADTRTAHGPNQEEE